ncbi:hypothetical protein [Merismopedia glauca]|uniref:RAMP superfamily protein n=1 Tax=Merismopedia glauca CCAP 1448/3 TaxID=1296344 RepID=A0A2T1BXB0_9CYAN|nr:hypothetical protein [Merismopedia glauca]PSB00563.1 hypothetical protein C7B64_22865 [Merismopedia glauca CCAP 1448/3]
MADSDYIPLMFQAQIEGRSQIHRLDPGVAGHQQQAYDWAQQWQDGCDAKNMPKFSPNCQTKDYNFTWRMVTNSGQDGVIRPVIGERGWAYYPGSSMKGAFARCCTLEQKLLYCGGVGDDGEIHPGILRFHGGYPKNDDWLDDSLVDLIHPQEGWQLNGNAASRRTVIQLSLYQPKLTFGISSLKPLSEDEWQQIWQIWEKALGKGIGSRVSAGYGQIKTHGATNLLIVGLQGTGLASKRIDGVAEFRPNGFKAALRGHTKRLLCGVTDDNTAEKFTNQLWGGVGGRNGAIAGLLGVAFSAPNLELAMHRSGQYEMPIYDTGEAVLNILLLNQKLSDQVFGRSRQLSETDRKNLKILATQIVKFSMLMGGFGKSWRRIDHSIFFPDYLQANQNPAIGCHWKFCGRNWDRYVVPVDRLADITAFLNGLQTKVAGFPLLQELQGGNPQNTLQEAWCEDNVQVWGRIAEDKNDSLAVRWFHGNYQGQKSIKRSPLTGSMGQIGRIWHRMYPRYQKQGEELKETGAFVELMTIFPNRLGRPEDIQKTADFLKFLEYSADFTHLW